MNTPICDFVRQYRDRNAVRMHMPGHKGKGSTNAHEDACFAPIYEFDITEIAGADELFHASSIIAESEQNASAVFGCPTFYSTEGSSLCIRAMLALCRSRQAGTDRPNVLAARNAHSAFATAVALLDLDVAWMLPEHSTLLSIDLTAEDVRKALACMPQRPICVYLTTPDYLGHMLDVRAISAVCHEFDVPLVVDNAHGAYLKFMTPSMHPMDLGADMCCDSAHKTLPVLTGGAYLHVREDLFDETRVGLAERVKSAMALFASTSPSWLILQSLDAANAKVAEWAGNCAESTGNCAESVRALRESLTAQGYTCYGEEPWKITLLTKPYGYTGEALAQLLREADIEPEYADEDAVVLMISPATTKEELGLIQDVLHTIPTRDEIPTTPEQVLLPEKKRSIREATLLPYEVLPVQEAVGCVAAMGNYACPPAVPIVMPGEVIQSEQAEKLRYYGYKTVKVIDRTIL